MASQQCTVALAVIIALGHSLSSVGEPAGRDAIGGGPRTLTNLLDLDAGRSPEPRGPALLQSTGSTERVPVPPAKAVEQARKLIRESFGSLFQKIAERPAFVAETLLEFARQTADESREYALLDEAEQVALKGNQVDLVVEVVLQRVETFDVDAVESMLKALDQLVVSEDDGGKIFRYFMAVARDALVSESFVASRKAQVKALETALAIAKLEIERARRLRRASRGLARPSPATWPAMRNEAEGFLRELEEREAAFAAYDTGMKLLGAKEDGEARRSVGLYLCGYREAWSEGLPYLEKCDCRELQNVSNRDIGSTAERSPAESLTIADMWWSLRSEPSGNELVRKVAAMRAGILYREVLARLTDPVDQALVRKRLSELEGRSPE